MTVRSSNLTIPGPGQAVAINISTSAIDIDLMYALPSDWDKGEFISIESTISLYALLSRPDGLVTMDESARWDPTNVDSTGTPATLPDPTTPALYPADTVFRFILAPGQRVLQVKGTGSGVLRIWKSSSLLG